MTMLVLYLKQRIHSYTYTYYAFNTWSRNMQECTLRELTWEQGRAKPDLPHYDIVQLMSGTCMYSIPWQPRPLAGYVPEMPQASVKLCTI